MKGTPHHNEGNTAVPDKQDQVNAIRPFRPYNAPYEEKNGRIGDGFGRFALSAYSFAHLLPQSVRSGERPERREYLATTEAVYRFCGELIRRHYFPH